MENAKSFMEWLGDQVIYWSPKLVTAIIVLIVGFWIVGMISRSIGKIMQKRGVDVSLQGFLKGLISITLKTLVLVSVAGMVGIQTTSFIALIGAAGLAVGLALQGSLANFAGGVLILIFKPYKVGDWIDAQGHAGTVHSIQIFNTVLKSPDNKTIIIPNGPMAGSSIVNYSTEDLRRVDMVFGYSYDDDLQKVESLLKSMVDADSRILKDPAPAVLLSELADSSVNFTLRLWCRKEDYWGIYWDFRRNIKPEFDKNGISIPYPQRDVHMRAAS